MATQQEIVDQLKVIQNEQEAKWIFYGNGDNVNDFINQLSLHFIKKKITTDEAKLQAAMGMLRKNAFKWADPYIKKIQAHSINAASPLPTWTDFVEDLKATFGFLDRKQVARRELERLKQGSNILKFVQEFRQLANVAEYNEDATLDKFLAALDTHYRNAVMYLDAEGDLNKAISAITKAYRITNAGRNAAVDTLSTSSNPVPKNNGYLAGQGPMDWSVDAAKRQCARDTCTCYNCGKPGHISVDCWAPKKPRRFDLPHNENGQFRPASHRARGGYTGEPENNNTLVLAAIQAQGESLSALADIVQGMMNHTAKVQDFGTG